MPRCVHIEIKGTDDSTQGLTLGAASLHDAVRQAVDAWAKLWWFDSSAVMIVKSGDERWTVRQEAVRGEQVKKILLKESRLTADCL